jgi:peptidoglycan/xylan/chitin deacetylase (PgdA/CDA1 family)
MSETSTPAFVRAVRRGRSAARGAALRRRGLPAGVALVYHRVADPAGDRSLELVPNHGRRLFEDQVRYLRRAYRVVAPSELPAAARRRSRGEPFPVAITFDDDLPTHHAEAAPILSALAVPAAFFIGGGSFDGLRVYWWDRLQTIADRDLIDSRLVELVLGAGSEAPPGRGALKPLARAIGAMPRERRRSIEEELGRRAGQEPRQTGMAVSEVSALADAGFEIGFHPVEHELLTNLSDAEVDAALESGRQRVAEAAGRDVDMVSYPHGKADARIAARAARAAYRLAFTGSPEAVSPGSDPRLLGRVEPSFESVEALAAQINGVLGAAEVRRP